MSTVKQKSDAAVVFYITSESSNPVRETAVINVNIQNALRRKEMAEVLFHEIPKNGMDVFSRRITIVKQPADTPGFGPGDDPDLEDIYDTDLPWIGKVTFRNASRQFRNRYKIGVAVDVVREIDGYLYLLSEKSLGHRFHGIDEFLCLIDLERHPYDPRSYKTSVRPVRDQKSIEEHFQDAKPIPNSLVKELTDIGYRIKDGDFIFSDDSVDGGDRVSIISCRLYGKLNRI